MTGGTAVNLQGVTYSPVDSGGRVWNSLSRPHGRYITLCIGTAKIIATPMPGV